VGKKTNVVVTSGFKKDDMSITLEETDIKRMGTGQIILEKRGDNKTLMKFNFILKNNPIMLAVFNLFMRRKMAKMLSNSLEKLENYFKTEKQAA
jgi:hypothetical protein